MKTRRLKNQKNYFLGMRNPKAKRSVAVLILFIATIGYLGHNAKSEVDKLTFISPIPKVLAVGGGASEETFPAVSQDSPHEQEKIERYIRTIFGSEANVAIAVSKNECSPRHRQYPRCVLKTEREYSVGIFQINIQSAEAKVHFARIPGNSLTEKVEWLKDPYNNVLMAYWIQSKSGWYPWTAYTSKNYLKDL